VVVVVADLVAVARSKSSNRQTLRPDQCDSMA